MIYGIIIGVLLLVSLLIFLVAKSGAKNRVNKSIDLTTMITEVQGIWLTKVSELGFTSKQINVENCSAKTQSIRKEILKKLYDDSEYIEIANKLLSSINSTWIKSSMKYKYIPIFQNYLSDEHIESIKWAEKQ